MLIILSIEYINNYCLFSACVHVILFLLKVLCQNAPLVPGLKTWHAWFFNIVFFIQHYVFDEFSFNSMLQFDHSIVHQLHF